MVRRNTIASGLVSGFALLAFTSASCGDPVTDEILKQLAEPCLTDSDCAATPLAPEHPDAKAVCVFGRCHVECEVTDDCRKFGLGEDIRCILGDKPTNVCQLADEVECTLDTTKTPAAFSSANCSGVEWCGPDGECRDKCGSASDCVTGQECIQSSCADPDEKGPDGLLAPVAGAGPGTPCSYSSECLGALVCRDHVCDEECKSTKDCASPATCVETTTPENGKVHVCQSWTGPTTPAHCTNKVKDEDEAAIDCGGAECFGCEAGSPCTDASDCVSAICKNQVCTHANCSDLAHNGTETGIDCGGPECPPCGDAQPCAQPSDCQGGLLCVQQTCVPPTCVDQTQNGAETGIDCGGGTCAGCDAGDPCGIPGDCATSVCAAGVCAPPTCNDGVENGLESGKDCGGGPASTCAPCGVGGGCSVGTDCVTGACSIMTMKCAAPGCMDGVSNGFETGTDCGGPTCAPCPAGEDCNVSADCASGAACNALGKCANTVTLHVVKSGNGSGMVTSTDGKITCGATCDATYFMGDPVTLGAAASGTSSFVSWSGGGCSTGSCVLSLSSNPTTVTATFTSPVTEFQLVRYQDAHFASAVSDGASNVFSCGGTLGGTFPQGHQLFNVGAGGEDALILKLDPAGSISWVRNFANPNNQQNHTCRRILSMPNGDAVAIVRSDGDIFYGASPTSCAPFQAMSLVRMAADGNSVAWSACYGHDITPRDATLDATGKIVVTGTFSGAVDFGGTVLTAASDPDVFIARYDPGNGALLAAKRLGNGGFDMVSSFAKIPGGYLVSGDCVGDVTFDAKTTSNAQGAGSIDICTIKLNDAWIADWVTQRGSSLDDFGGAAAVLADGTIGVAATFNGNSVDFGDSVFRDASYYPDVVLLRLNPMDGTLSTTLPNVVTYASTATGGGPARVTAMQVDAAGRIHVGGGAELGDAGATFDFAGTVRANLFVLTTSTANFGAVLGVLGGDVQAQTYAVEHVRQLQLDPQAGLLVAAQFVDTNADPFALGILGGTDVIARVVP